MGIDHNKTYKKSFISSLKLLGAGTIGTTALAASCVVNGLDQEKNTKIKEAIATNTATASADCFFSSQTTAPTGTITYETSTANATDYVTITSISGFSGTNLKLKDPITFPGDTTEYHLLSVSARAFRSCSSLYGSLDLSSNYLDNFGFAAFGSCKNLESVILPASLTTIGNNAFQDTAINSVDFSQCTVLDTIGTGAFSSTGIEVLDLSNCTRLTTLGQAAFYGTKMLTSIKLPDELTTIGPMAFAFCTSLKTLNLGKTSVTTIQNNAFNGCPIDSYNFPATLTSIELAAIDVTSCKTITFLNPSTDWVASTQGTGIFVGTHQYDIKIQVPSTTSAAYRTAFSSCEWFNDAYMTVAELSAVNTSPSYRFFEDGGEDTIQYMVYVDAQKTPLYFDITDARTFTLANCKLKAKTEPGGENIPIRNISAQSFMGNTNLAGYFDMSANTNLQEIQANAFDGCNGITSVKFSPNVSLIGESAFSNCTSIAAINLTASANISSIGDYAFASCTSLTSVNLQDNTALTELGSFAFRSCTGLTSFSLPATMTSISEGAFSHCTNLATLDLTSYADTSLSAIDAYAFAGCSGLTSVSIPSSITSIGPDAFSTCKMDTITFYNADPTWLESNGVGDNWLSGYYGEKLTFKVPYDSYWDYNDVMTNETLIRWGLYPTAIELATIEGPIPPAPGPGPSPDTNKTLALGLGLGIGLGVPVLGGAIAGTVVGVKKHKKKTAKK